MNIITQISRLLVGFLFIFSGLIKLNDPMGFSFKLEDYFAPGVLDLPFLTPWALQIAIFVVILEVMLGVALLVGYRAKLTIYSLLGLIVFFTFLTFYSAYFNKVTDCGCFGDAIPLTPWQSFYKDIVLLVLILVLWAGLKYIKPVMANISQLAVLTVALVMCSFLGFWVLNHLPLKDFRPYAEGKSISDGMKMAEELGLEGPVYDVVYTMEDAAGKRVEVTGRQYMDEKWWEKIEWKMQEEFTRSILVKPGYEPPIHDFAIDGGNGDITDQILQSDEYLLIIAYNLDKSSKKGFEKIAALAWELDKTPGLPILAVTATSRDKAEIYRHDIQAPFDFANADETALKTIIRSNPGLVYIKKGVVIKKWHYNDTPTVEELNNFRK